MENRIDENIREHALEAAVDILTRMESARWEIKTSRTHDDLMMALESAQRVIDEGAWGSFRELMEQVKAEQDKSNAN